MAFGKSKQPKTVAQITQGLQTMLDDLSVAEAQFQEKQRKNEEEIARRAAENKDIESELKTNGRVSAKFKELLGMEVDKDGE
ncbi:MAG: hypothetical protein GOVbin1096_18 [Prokaryotic dsDNA virus sp.]|jgi:small-conductance mechanosensitive channel|nr:MAG: hypothetical protein GOVbin1096_18 [Prokaryotic dsDNA virus sp.]|tara:strand:- start:46982 stop:47227 length:246 start_codon:yes stop_codon:yes gene_type:complete